MIPSVRIGRHEDWRIAELLMAFASVLYGLWLLVPADTLSGTPYRYVRALGVSECLWGLLFVLTGLLRVWVCAKRKHTLRQSTALAGIAKWTIWWGLLLAAAPVSALSVFCLVFSVGSVLSYWSSVDCEVVEGECNGLLEHRVFTMAARVQRERSEDP